MSETAAKFPASAVTVSKMYYTMCEDPGCGALNDYADTRPDAEVNRRRHIAWHRRGGLEYDPTRREVKRWTDDRH